MKSKRTPKVLPRPLGGKGNPRRQVSIHTLLWQFCFTPETTWKTPFLALRIDTAAP